MTFIRKKKKEREAARAVGRTMLRQCLIPVAVISKSDVLTKRTRLNRVRQRKPWKARAREPRRLRTGQGAGACAANIASFAAPLKLTMWHCVWYFPFSFFVFSSFLGK